MLVLSSLVLTWMFRLSTGLNKFICEAGRSRLTLLLDVSDAMNFAYACDALIVDVLFRTVDSPFSNEKLLIDLALNIFAPLSVYLIVSLLWAMISATLSVE